MVRSVGLEPTCLAASGPKPGASANFANCASLTNILPKQQKNKQESLFLNKSERKMKNFYLLTLQIIKMGLYLKT